MQPNTTLPRTTAIKELYGQITAGADDTILTSGTLLSDKIYVIIDYNSGDDFSNLIIANFGTVNTTGCIFLTNGTTPTDWTHGSSLALWNLTFTELHNTLGFDYEVEFLIQVATISCFNNEFKENKIIIEGYLDYYSSAASTIQSGYVSDSSVLIAFNRPLGDETTPGKAWIKLSVYK